MAKRPPAPEKPQEAPQIFEENTGMLSGRRARIVMGIATVVMAVMFLLAFAFCLAGGIRYHQPRYFLLIINLILSTAVTLLLIFWYFRGALGTNLMWYIFVQCTFLFFQCVTTDIFAWYEQPTEAIKASPIGPNCTFLHDPTCNATKPTNATHIF